VRGHPGQPHPAPLQLEPGRTAALLLVNNPRVPRGVSCLAESFRGLDLGVCRWSPGGSRS
jgi:hypothetical protein